ncbi:MAG: DNA primase [Spiroplasma phoeniceum]|nr:MAG: DNA primase [Spiroplasma phoeniceum]UZQ32938.1 MAG: DNA primase [Spiroplasma phoeniceum]
MDIVKILGEYINLTKRGRNYIGICPFHSDSRPSLTVSPVKMIFKCFVCGKGGNVPKFISEFKEISYQEACVLLNKEYGYDTNYKYTEPIKVKLDDQKLKKMYEINYYVSLFFKNQLNQSVFSNIKSYLLDERKLSMEQIEKFNLGFASYKNELRDYLLKRGYCVEELDELGLIRKNVNNEYIDSFKGRIMFPICNEFGNIVGFSGRDLQEDTNIKYLNTPETPIFEKSKVLYNFNNINDSTDIYLVEGYMDVIALSKLGKPAVALMGTNLSAHNELLIVKKFANIYIFLDNDEPGKQAAEKIKYQLSKYKKNTKVIHLDDKYKDIDEYVRNKECILESMTR